MTSPLASSSISLNGKWTIITELTDAALSDVSALPAALDAIISAIVLEKTSGIVVAVAAACIEKLSHLMRATFYSEIAAHRLLPGLSLNRLPQVRLETLRCLAAIAEGLGRGTTGGGLPCSVLKCVEEMLTAEGTSQEERSMALLACVRSWDIHSLAMIIKTYGKSDINTLKTESDWNNRLENHPWGALVLLLHRHFPPSTSVVALREILCIAEDQQHMATGFVDQNASSGIDQDPCVVVQDAIDTMPNVDDRFLRLLHPLLIGPDLSLRAMARDICSAGLVRNPEECSKGLIGILTSPDRCSETIKNILYLFSEAPLFKIDNHELIVRIATTIQEIICGLKHTALKYSKETVATITSTPSSNAYMLELAIMATINCINGLSHFHSEEKKTIELSWVILREVESMSRNEDNSNSPTICTSNEGWKENTIKAILERLSRASTLSAQCMLSAIIMSHSPMGVAKAKQVQWQNEQMEGRSSSSHIFNPRFYLSNVLFCAALSRAALSAVELSEHPNEEEKEVNKRMTEKEDKVVQFPLPITAELLNSLPLTSSPNRHRASIVGSGDDPNIFCDDRTAASAARYSMSKVVTLFRLHSGTFVDQNELSKALINGGIVHAFERWGGWKLYELAREAILHGFFDVALCSLCHLEKLIEDSNLVMMVSEPWVKMLRCLVEAEVKGGVVTRNLEKPCINKDTGNATIWTTAVGERGASAARSVMDCMLESIEWLLITRNVCGGADGEDVFAFQKEMLTSRLKLFEGIRLLLRIPKKIACKRLLIESDEASSRSLSTKEKLWLETLSRQSASLNAQVLFIPYPFSNSWDYFKKIPSDVLSCIIDMRSYDVKMGLKNGHIRTTEMFGKFRRKEDNCICVQGSIQPSCVPGGIKEIIVRIKYSNHNGGGPATITSVRAENKKGYFIARRLLPPEWLHDIQGNRTQVRLSVIIRGGTGETWIVPYHLSVQVEIDDPDK